MSDQHITISMALKGSSCHIHVHVTITITSLIVPKPCQQGTLVTEKTTRKSRVYCINEIYKLFRFIFILLITMDSSEHVELLFSKQQYETTPSDIKHYPL